MLIQRILDGQVWLMNLSSLHSTTYPKHWEYEEHHLIGTQNYIERSQEYFVYEWHEFGTTTAPYEI